jgi:SAM-dependent methyltransferase
MNGHEQRNREFWDSDADAYQAAHGEKLTAKPAAWGTWRIPESRLRVLGAVAGRDVLELGCGAAQWSIHLARREAHVVGLDVSAVQLRHARRNRGRGHVRVPLVQASGEHVPFADASFDVVFCDHGAMSFCDPEVTVAEAARLLRSGGLLAWCCATPLHYLMWDDDADRPSDRMHQGWWDLDGPQYDEGSVDFVLAPGDWIRLLRANGFEVEDLIHLRAPARGTTTYTEFTDRSWARRWPAEEIWRARRR